MLDLRRTWRERKSFLCAVTVVVLFSECLLLCLKSGFMVVVGKTLNVDYVTTILVASLYCTCSSTYCSSVGARESFNVMTACSGLKNLLPPRRRSFAPTCPRAKMRQLKIFLTIDACYQIHRPLQRSTMLAYFCHTRPLGNTHCWHRLWVSGLCLFIAVDIVQLRYSATVQGKVEGEGGEWWIQNTLS